MAQVHLYEYHGAHGSRHECTGDINFGAGDTVITHPKNSPLARSSYSYEKWLRIVVTNLKRGEELSNFRVWMTKPARVANNGDVIRTSAINIGYLPPAYRKPIATASDVAITPMPTSDPGEATIGINGSVGHKISRESTYTMTDYFVIQVQVANNTITPIAWTLHIAYD
jgi:hypothetical protein